MKNRFRPYNKSLLASVFMSTNDCKYIWNKHYIPYYYNINAKNKHGITPLIINCYYDNEYMTRLLLNHPEIDINSKDNDGWTALQYAKIHSSESIINLLQSHNAK